MKHEGEKGGGAWAYGVKEDVGRCGEQNTSAGISLLSVTWRASVAWDGVRRCEECNGKEMKGKQCGR